MVVIQYLVLLHLQGVVEVDYALCTMEQVEAQEEEEHERLVLLEVTEMEREAKEIEEEMQIHLPAAEGEGQARLGETLIFLDLIQAGEEMAAQEHHLQ
jgi:hypothetical protein